MSLGPYRLNIECHYKNVKLAREIFLFQVDQDCGGVAAKTTIKKTA